MLRSSDLRRIAALLAGLALCACGGKPEAPRPLPPLDPPTLAAQAELAEQDAFYLVLELASKKLSLRFHGALIREYAVEAISVGRPRVLVRSTDVEGEWRGRVWHQATLDPPLEVSRTVIEPPTGEMVEEAPVAVPPTPEERFPAPERYRVRFAEGLALEVHSGARGSASWREPFLQVWRAGQDGLRLRLQMSPGDAGALYRSLPAGVSLLVVDQAAPS